ncbi:unnamed protein product [Aureobasidium pullulans]|nr:unnamed protein product [Aureobasidium pullulans]
MPLIRPTAFSSRAIQSAVASTPRSIPGEKYQEEGWERIFYWGFFGSMAFGIIGYAYKPDTSIQTWALEEARRRLEAEGILADPEDE